MIKKNKIFNTSNKKFDKEKFKTLFFSIIGIIIIGISYYFIINVTGRSLSCKFHDITGLQCALCGITRICMSILNGNFNILHYNYGLFLLLPILIFLFCTYGYCYIYNIKINNKIEDRCTIFIFVYLIVWGILRNILHI